MTQEYCEFSVAHWRQVIQKALALGYRFYSFTEYLSGLLPRSRTILLRHDIDVSLERATLLAEMERQFDVRATFFVRLHSRFYQPHSPESLQYLHRLARMKVELGLHYERQYYETIGMDHLEMLRQDTKTLEGILGSPVTGCSAHRGGTFPPFDNDTIKSLGLAYEAYAPEFIQSRKYISDSRRKWREGCLCQWLGRLEHLTVLTHPVWWFDRTGSDEVLLDRIQRGD